MDKLKRARMVLEQARAILTERLVDEIIESRNEILDDAEGCSYNDDIDSLQEKIGGRLNNVNSLILNLPSAKPSNPNFANGKPSLATPAIGHTESGTTDPSQANGSVELEEKPADFALFGKQIMQNDIDGAAQTLAEVFDVELELATHCAVAFRERLNDDPTTVQKTMRLRNRLQAGENNDSLMILWDCFRLQGPRAIEVLQTLKSRLAAA